MGNVNGREDAAIDPTMARSNSEFGARHTPLLFTHQAPLHRVDDRPFSNQMWQGESHLAVGNPLEQGIPTVITWSYGGNEVAVEGSWDKWTSRKILQRSGKDHSVLLVLPSGIYHYKFIVDGEWRYIPELPFEANGVTGVCNILDVHNYVPEIFDSVTEFEAPSSPDISYGQTIPSEEDFAKEPAAAPPQFQKALVMQKLEEASCSKPRHVMLNHVFVETGFPSESVVAVGLTHRFQSKFVTVVLYKPRKS